MQHIRNFSIIAHIDHGKSTLADRIIQLCGGLSDREMADQVLDSMDLERERGITIEAQTAANCYTAIEQGVEVIPVLNKIDLPSADPEKAIQEIEDVIGIHAQEALRVSAKTGENVPEILEAVIARVPPPKGDPEARLQALVIDSWFDNYVGVVMLVRMVQGALRPKDKVLLMSTGAAHLCEQVGVFTPKSQTREELVAGE